MRIALVYSEKPPAPRPEGARPVKPSFGRPEESDGASSSPDDPPDDLYEEYDRPETIKLLCDALAAAGHTALPEPYGPDLGGRLHAGGYELVFNIAEGTGGRDREAHVPALCELIGLPYTGSDALTMAVTLDKWACRRLVSPDVIVAGGTLVRGPDDEQGIEAALALLRSSPVIVKPNDEGSSKGIRGDPVARDEAGLRSRVKELCARYGRPALVEEFVPGTEITIGIVGNDPPEVIGIMEVVPHGEEAARGADFIYSLEVKRDWRNRVRYRIPPALPPEVIEQAKRAALSAYRSVGARDLTRVDFRVRANGEPVFLEMNPLPGLDPVSGDIVILARAMGIEHGELIERVLGAALSRIELGTIRVGGPSRTRQGREDRNARPSRREAARFDPPFLRASGMAPTSGSSALRVAVLTSAPPPALPGERVTAEMDLSGAAGSIADALRALGHTPVPLVLHGGPDELLAALRAEAPDVLFNLLEAPGGRVDLETAAAGLLEWSGLPLTGNDADTLSRLRHKGLVRALLSEAGVAVAPGRLVVDPAAPFRDDDDLSALFPAFVKPACEDGSVGIGPESLVPDARSLLEVVRRLFEEGHGPVLVEAFLPGRELNLLVTGGEVPEQIFCGEVCYRLPAGAPPFQTYGSKWRPEDPGYGGITTVHPAEVEEPLAARLRALAARCWKVTGAYGYARVDVRCDADGWPRVLEINPNPDLAPDAGTQRSLRGNGIALTDFVAQQIRLARARAARAGRAHAR